MAFDSRVLHLGDAFALIAPVAGALITGGATVASSFIVADAQKTVAKRNASTQLQLALSADRRDLEIAKLNAANESQQTAVESKAVSVGGVVFGLALLGYAVLGGR